MISRILVAVDDELFAGAIEGLLKKMSFSNFHIFRVVHVIEPKTKTLAWPNDVYKKEAEELVANVAKRLRERFPDAIVEEALLEGYTADSIIDDAIVWEADMIIVGAHGRRGVRRFLLGSVSAAVAAYAPCSVLVVRTPMIVQPVKDESEEVENRLVESQK